MSEVVPRKKNDACTYSVSEDDQALHSTSRLEAVYKDIVFLKQPKARHPAPACQPDYKTRQLRQSPFTNIVLMAPCTPCKQASACHTHLLTQTCQTVCCIHSHALTCQTRKVTVQGVLGRCMNGSTCIQTRVIRAGEHRHKQVESLQRFVHHVLHIIAIP